MTKSDNFLHKAVGNPSSYYVTGVHLIYTPDRARYQGNAWCWPTPFKKVKVSESPAVIEPDNIPHGAVGRVSEHHVIYTYPKYSPDRYITRYKLWS
jgi:hypothetical protein